MRLCIPRPAFSLPAMLLLMALAFAADAAAGHPAMGEVPEAVRERLAESALVLGRDGSPGVQALRLSGSGAPPSLRAVALMCAFADSQFYSQDGSADQSQSTLPYAPYAAHDFHYFDHRLSDVAAYYNDVSAGRFSFEYELLPTVLTLPREMAWYGDNPEYGEYRIGLAVDAVAAADPLVDFSGYDTVILIHAGAGEETDILGNSPEQVYSGYIGPEDFAGAVEDTLIATPFIPTADTDAGGDPVELRHVLVLPENEFQDSYQGYGGYFGSLGVYCFEVGLRLGMLSLSDFTPETLPDSQGIGEFGLMGYGLFVGAGFIPDHPCAFNKVLMGWLDPVEADPAAGAVWELPPAEGGGAACARVDISGREYWLLEYRLQDPDGNGIFSFPGDLNGNGVPDFYDADSNTPGFEGMPAGPFDPATDTHESLLGAEFDFFMSENSARAPDEKGSGSGLYIWHIDEGVIADAFADGSRLFNSDPARKGVDLEEADGIQDLDVRLGTPYVLGGDDDAFRGEGADTFGPGTMPATVTAGGAPTGIVIDEISDVVLATGDTITYAPTMSFRCGYAAEAAAVADAVAELPGVDLAGSHLLAVDLDPQGDGAREIVAAGSGGRVLAFRHDLADFIAAPAERGLLALGTDADGLPAEWIGPPAAGDVDGDGRPELVLAAESGLYLFNGEDGSEYADGDSDPDSRGLLMASGDIRTSAVLVAGIGDPLRSDMVVGMVSDSFRASLLRLDAEMAQNVLLLLPEPAADMACAPLVWGGTLWAITVGEEPGSAFLQSAATAVALPAEPARISPLATDDALVVPCLDGAALVIEGPDDPVARVWTAAGPLSPPAPGLAFVAEGVFTVAGEAGDPRTGWPRRPQPAVGSATADRAASPLVMEDADGDWHYLFTARDGRIFQYDHRGVPAAGFPLPGPGDAAGTPIWADLDGDSGPELAAAGTTLRLAGIDPDSGEPVVEPLSRIALWRLDAPAVGTEVWPQWRGGAARASVASRQGSAQPEGDTLLEPGSRICYPNPLASGPLRVRALALRDCSVRAVLYNLEGEQVAASAAATARAGDPVEVSLSAPEAASGVYLCRLSARGDGLTEESIHPVAIER